MLAFSVVLSTNPHVSNCLYQVSLLLIDMIMAGLWGGGVCFSIN